ncbi:hypothetical protein SSYM_2628 [Serratia symbiotica str. Tucson]|uniref:Uncharacterized protein n=1 Tax=Serratia symbiotica str. Tucson TaxID=914128 RepID=E9CPX6_9GAMM|nr:hypothetical protein SSYM_2628 [Serratia symbiotica str. Tucson]
MTGTKDKTKTLAFFIAEVLLYLHSAAVQFHHLTGFELVRTAEDKPWLVCCCTPVTFLAMARYAVTVALVFTIFSVFFVQVKMPITTGIFGTGKRPRSQIFWFIVRFQFLYSEPLLTFVIQS